MRTLKYFTIGLSILLLFVTLFYLFGYTLNGEVVNYHLMIPLLIIGFITALLLLVLFTTLSDTFLLNSAELGKLYKEGELRFKDNEIFIEAVKKVAYKEMGLTIEAVTKEYEKLKQNT